MTENILPGDKPPKTADGAYIVRGPTTVYAVTRYGSIGSYHLLSFGRGYWALSCDSRVKVSECCSTREAAEDAKKEPK